MLSICFISSRQAEPLASGRLWRWLQEQNNNPGTQVSRDIPQIWNAWSTTGSFKNYPYFFKNNRTGKLDAGKTNSFEYRRRENASSDRTWGDYNLLRTLWNYDSRTGWLLQDTAITVSKRKQVRSSDYGLHVFHTKHTQMWKANLFKICNGAAH